MLARVAVGVCPVFLLALACAGPVEDAAKSSESALLPNSQVFDVAHDGPTYKAIAEWFAAKGYDLHVDKTGFAPSWPLLDPKPSALNRMGTPIAFSAGASYGSGADGPIYGYFSTGLDVIRSNATAVIDSVSAPHGGDAFAFDWTGQPLAAGQTPYASVVAIHDSVTHIVTILMHVAPTSAIATATAPVPVTKGSSIGRLAPAPLPTPKDATYAHTKVVFFDGENKLILNPAPLFADYKDTTAPTLSGVYVGTEAGTYASSLSTGKLDLVLTAYDRDDNGGRNFELSALAYTLKDQDDNVLRELPKCSLDQVYESAATPGSFHAKDLIDFGTGENQINEAWPGTDVGNGSRTFRYALTNLAVENGRCVVKDDASAFLEVAETVKKISVAVTGWDANGKQSDKTLTVSR
jgi:hypothetical protein